MFIFPFIASAQLTVPQGGTGTTTFPQNYVLIGGPSSLRVTAVATSSLGLLGSTSLSATAPITYSPNTGVIACPTCSTSSGSPFPFTPFANYNATSTPIGFLQGLFSTASSTFNSNVFFPNLTAGLAFIGTNGIHSTVATSTLTPSSPLTGAFTQIGSGGALGCQVASGSQAGCLSLADWTTFNNKQTAGNYITALTGDVTASGPGSVASTLATVNASPGTFTYATLTVNGKGLVTSASNGTAPVTSVSGTANQITSSGGTTPTIALATHVIFPAGGFESIIGSTTNATTTGSLYLTGVTVSRPLYVDSTGKVGSAGSGVSGNCVNWGANNTLGDAGSACGSGGGSTFPFTVFPNYNATSTAIGFLNGLFSTASSTFNSAVRFSALSDGGLGVNAGLLYSGATTTAGTGLSYTGNSFNVNTTQNITKLSNLTTNGFVKTSGGDGTLSVDTNTYDTFAYPFTGQTWGNSTTSVLSIAGIIDTASTTINASTTISGIVTLTGATTTAANGFSIGAGCYAIAGNCLTAGAIGGGFTQAVNWATTGVLGGTPTYSNGTAGVGATLTEIGTGALSVDSNNPSINDRVLVKNQASGLQNGIYIVTATGSGIASYILTRATDYNTPTEITPGINTYVLSGTVNTDSTWAVSYTPPLVIGTNTLSYAESAAGGTVTSVAASVPAFLSIAGSPITTSGTLAISYSGTALPIANGGTNSTSFTSNALNYFDGSKIASITTSFFNSAANWLGFGTTTPHWLMDLATSTDPQLALTSSSATGNFHWVFNNIFGNLFISTSTANTFATSSNSDPYSGYIEFPNNGGCIGCTDILLSGGINLRNGKYLNATSSTLTANQFTDLYTAPAGRRAYWFGSGVYTKGTGLTYQLALKSGGSYYVLSASSTVSTNNFATISPGFILEPGESASVLTTASTAVGLRFRESFVEYDSSVPFFTVRDLNPAGAATTTIYTVPPNRSAALTAGTLSLANAPNFLIMNNTTSSTISYWWLYLPSTQTTADTNVNSILPQNAVTMSASQPASFSAGGTGITFLNAGDKIQYWLSSTIGNNSIIWFTVNEH